jgi:two-component system chemotaxis response regulator CheB
LSGQKRIRVLIVDDSAIARDLLERGLSADPDIEVVGKAADAYVARDKIVLLKPNVMTLDVEMPRMDGIAFMRKLMPQYPIPVVVVSAVTAEGSRRALEALEAGALEVVAKPSARDPAGLKAMIADLTEKVKNVSRADPGKLLASLKSTTDYQGGQHGDGGTAPAGQTLVRKASTYQSDSTPSSSPAGGSGSGNSATAARPEALKAAIRSAMATAAAVRKVIAIGASTGGTTALARIVTMLPADAPPVLIVQHMPPVFTRMFAESMNRQSRVEVREAEDGDTLMRGRVLIAPGDRHLRIRKAGSGYIVGLSDGPKVCGHRPSVDVLFASVADLVGAEAVAALLTGMGRDGADGLLAIRRAGGRCVAQDESTSVVFGMPREAWENGAAEMLVPIDNMAHEIMTRAGGSLLRGA